MSHEASALIRETRDIAEIDALARSLWFTTAAHGEPWTSLAPVIADERNIVLRCDEEHGAFICHHQEEYTYALQRLFPNDVCSSHTAAAVIHWMFTRTPCLRLLHQGWTLDLADWMHHEPSLQILGRGVRTLLQNANVTIPADEASDRWIGVAVSMIQGGQLAKGVAVYNGCARPRGLSIVRAVSANPPRIYLDGSILSFIDSGVVAEGAGSSDSAARDAEVHE